MKIVKTIEKFFCDVCGKEINAIEARQEVIWDEHERFFRAGFTHDRKVIIQDYFRSASKEQKFEDSVICYDCKLKYLEDAKKKIKDLILSNKYLEKEKANED